MFASQVSALARFCFDCRLLVVQRPGCHCSARPQQQLSDAMQFLCWHPLTQNTWPARRQSWRGCWRAILARRTSAARSSWLPPPASPPQRRAPVCVIHSRPPHESCSQIGGIDSLQTFQLCPRRSAQQAHVHTCVRRHLGHWCLGSSQSTEFADNPVTVCAAAPVPIQPGGHGITGAEIIATAVIGGCALLALSALALALWFYRRVRCGAQVASPRAMSPRRTCSHPLTFVWPFRLITADRPKMR